MSTRLVGKLPMLQNILNLCVLRDCSVQIINLECSARNDRFLRKEAVKNSELVAPCSINLLSIAGGLLTLTAPLRAETVLLSDER